MLTEKYNHKESEKKWQEYWRRNKVYTWKNDLPREQTFVIDTPPPTVSGLLHMGHVFSYTQADFVARFHRMRGKDVFYPMGFDDNGLPTERLVEKIIGKKAGVYESENGHGSFVSKCREVVEDAEKEFEAMFNEIALSVDWEQKYQTISPESQKISQASFIDLYHKKFVEKKFEPVFWDVADRTALAQADLVDKEIEGVMNYVEFAIDGSDEKIEIMTTRPELLPACVAVMVNPDDSRYKHLHGKFAITPLFAVKVKIIADEDVQVDKGTGAVMCCTFGDETDIKWWKKHALELRVVIGKDGKMNDILGITDTKNDNIISIVPVSENTNENCLNKWLVTNCIDLDNFYKIYKNFITNKKIKEAKDAITEELKAKNLLLKQEPIKRAVKCAERSGMPIEILVMPQWFIKILDKKEALKQKARECNWHPEYMRVRIEQWIDGLSWDWCISRQRFFGVKFPVWYSKRAGEEGKILVAEFSQLEQAVKQNRSFDPAIDLPIDPQNKNGSGFYSREEVDAETDILDTWATSSVSPQLSSGAINQEMLRELLASGAINQAEFNAKLQRHEKLFPANMRPQAHEIIRTWAFYTIAKALLHEDKIPWENLMISGWCLAADKTKMSKSKGNVVTPTALIEEKSSDIVRYWASTSHLGADTAYSEDVFKIGHKLVTKLFNAAKFVAINFEVLAENSLVQNQSAGANLANQDSTASNNSAQHLVKTKTIFCAADLWILSKLHQTLAQATSSFEKFEYARAREKIEEFFWHDFCDNYLEIVKVRSYGLKAEKLAGQELDEDEKQQIIAQQLSGIHTLKICLETLLKLFAPFIPHICEEIYAGIFTQELQDFAAQTNQAASIHARGNWPKIEDYFFDEAPLNIGEAALGIIFEVRKFKSDNSLSMKTTVQKLTVQNPLDLSSILEDLRNVCNTIELDFSKGDANVVINL